MRKDMLVISVTALSAVMAAGAAIAQTQREENHTGGATSGQGTRTESPAMHQDAPSADRALRAPSSQEGQQAGQHNGRDTSGAAENDRSSTPNTGSPRAETKSKSQDNAAHNDNAGQGSATHSNAAQGDTDKGNNAAQGNAGRRNNTNAAQTNGSSEHNSTSGVGASGTHAAVNLTTEQRTKVREVVIHRSDAPRVNNVNFSINVGTVVPRTVHVVPLPAEVVEITPEWRGYDYFLVGDQIVIVEPGSLRIVAVIPA